MRAVGGAALTVVALLVLTAVLLAVRAPEQLQTSGFLYLAVVVLGALAFGGVTAVVGSVASALLMDYYFLPPTGHLTIYSGAELVAWSVFLLVCLGVGLLATSRRHHLRALRRAGDRLGAANFELMAAERELRASLAARTELARTEAALEATRRTDTFRRDLLATVSHELRTPLAALMGLGTALAHDGGRSALRHPEYPDLIVSEARRIDRLIRDLLELARIETGQLQVETEVIDLGDAVREAARRWESQLAVEVVVPPSSTLVVADWDRVQQLLDNGLANVQRHAGTDRARLDVSAPSPVRSTAAECVVGDRGRGIPPQVQEHLFEHYSGNRGARGLGLGLAVSRGLAEAMGGALWIDSPLTGGTQLHLLLPLAPATEPVAPAPIGARA